MLKSACKKLQNSAQRTVWTFINTRALNGTDFSTVLDGKYSSFGENLDGGAKSPAAVMKDWIGSASHYANIVNRNFLKLGVGYNYFDADKTDKRFYWTQLFADSLKAQETVDVSKASPQVNTVSKFISLTEGNDTYSNSQYGVTIQALGGNDSITNSGLLASISGGADSDTIDNRGNFSIINAGNGNDSINLNAAQEILIQYTGGNDSISGFNDTSTLGGGQGIWQCQEFCVIRIVDLTPFFQRKIFRVT